MKIGSSWVIQCKIGGNRVRCRIFKRIVGKTAVLMPKREAAKGLGMVGLLSYISAVNELKLYNNV